MKGIAIYKSAIIGNGSMTLNSSHSFLHSQTTCSAISTSSTACIHPLHSVHTHSSLELAPPSLSYVFFNTLDTGPVAARMSLILPVIATASRLIHLKQRVSSSLFILCTDSFQLQVKFKPANMVYNGLHGPASFYFIDCLLVESSAHCSHRSQVLI